MQRQPLTDSVKIERSTVTLREKVSHALRDAILNFQLLPGDRLVERELCELLGVSRTSVREALRHLESEGLVEYLDNKGPIVAIITQQDAKEIYETRASLECMIVELFTSRASEEQLVDLEYALRKLQTRLKEGEIIPILESVNAFYEVLYQGAGNRIASNILRQLQARISYLRATSVSHDERYKNSSDEMSNIVEAIKTRSVEKAKQACLRHIEKAEEVALKVLAKQQAKEKT